MNDNTFSLDRYTRCERKSGKWTRRVPAEMAAHKSTQRSGEQYVAYKCEYAPSGVPHFHIGHFTEREAAKYGDVSNVPSRITIPKVVGK